MVCQKTPNTIQEVKKAFLHVCQQYEQLGHYLKIEAKAMAEGNQIVFAKAREVHCRQYLEAGEQLKILGTAIDRLGGSPVLQLGPANLEMN